MPLVKGAKIGVGSPRGQGWEDRRHGLLVPLPRGAVSVRCACSQPPRPACERHRVAGAAPRTRDPVPAVRTADLGGLIGRCWQPQPVTCRARRGVCLW
ncbi:MAG TPA: hypothetical protein DEV93_14660 [Chloroflexi bacterium]|nr:hypothetical protein [Chloroflexota bacterium]